MPGEVVAEEKWSLMRGVKYSQTSLKQTSKMPEKVCQCSDFSDHLQEVVCFGGFDFSTETGNILWILA